MTRLSDIVYEQGRHWVARTPKGFEVYRIDGVASVRCAVIGFVGQKGLERAKAEIERREKAL